MATVSDKTFDGYAVAYDREEIQFPVYVLAVGSVALLIAAFIRENVFLFAFAVVVGCIAYHNYPLLETGRPRLAASRHGLFIEGLGLLQWRAVEHIDIIPVVVRAIIYHELEILLNQPLASALAVDWRSRPLHRTLMRLPSSLSSKNTIRIPLDVLDRPAHEIHRTFLRMWRHYRGLSRQDEFDQCHENGHPREIHRPSRD
jgi:hypothetical protein